VLNIPEPSMAVKLRKLLIDEHDNHSKLAARTLLFDESCFQCQLPEPDPGLLVLRLRPAILQFLLR